MGFSPAWPHGGGGQRLKLLKDIRENQILYLGKTKSTVKVGLLEYCWTPLQIYSRRSDNHTLFYQSPQEVTFEEPLKRHSWKDSKPYTLTVSLVSLNIVRPQGFTTSLLFATAFSCLSIGACPVVLQKHVLCVPFLHGCGFFAHSWKLPAYSGASLLTVDKFSFFTYNWSFFAYSFSFFTYSWSFFTYSGKVRLIRALRDCKKRN